MNVIHKARVTYVMVGYGDLVITDCFLSWNKSATSYLVFGAANAMTDNHLCVAFSEIVSIEKYTYFPGGGLSLMDIKGKIYKFSFKRKKDFKIVYEYLTKHIAKE